MAQYSKTKNKIKDFIDRQRKKEKAKIKTKQNDTKLPNK